VAGDNDGGFRMGIDLGAVKQAKAAELWVHEEHDFTPWLATEANFGLLAWFTQRKQRQSITLSSSCRVSGIGLEATPKGALTLKHDE
jgi:hypothetical protein